MKPAADVVAHPAERHPAQRLERHVAGFPVASEGVRTQQEEQLRGPRELRRAAEAAVAGIERLRERRDAGLDGLSSRHGRAVGGGLVSAARAAQALDDRVGRLNDVVAALAPRAGKLLEDFHEPGPAPARRRRESMCRRKTA